MKKRKSHADNVARRNSERFLKVYQHFQTESCVLCGAPAAFMGIFFPVPRLAKVLGFPPDTTRTFAYGLCDDCAKREKSCQQVEVVFLSPL